MDLIIALLFYAYFSICLQIIGTKTNAQKIWMAWVPVANVLFMCRIAKVTKKWFIAFCVLLGLFLLTATLPPATLAVSLCSAVYFALLWMKIAGIRNKPAWWGILAVLPVVSIFAIGYLAFSNSASTPIQP